MINSYSLVVKQDENSKKVAESLKNKLKGTLEYNQETPDLVISVGGDGTMLYAVHEYFHLMNTTFFIGVHTGTLGFYTDYQANELDALVQDIKSGQYSITKRAVLEVEVVSKEGNRYYHALNEMRIENPHYTQVLHVDINGEHLETFRGNGLCVSTPSGSTAYNKSLGGAVIHPDLEVMQLSEVAGIHHNAYRSLGSSIVLGKEQMITLTCDVFNGVFIGIDQFSYDLKEFEKINISLAKQAVQCIQYRPLTFISRIKRTFIS